MKINAITFGILVAATSMSVSAKEGSVVDLDNLWRQGDVEFNIDGFSHSKELVGQPYNGKEGNWDMNGRIRLGVGHTFTSRSGVEVDVFAQPLLNIRGGAGVDDASLSFAGKDTSGEWKLKLGRYEAFDMFPLNQDTFIQYSGDTANDLYADGSGYAYQMKEGRGRTNNGGGILIAREVGKFYFENNTLIKEGTSLFETQDGVKRYHGHDVEDRKNEVMIRPVIAYNDGPYTVAVAGETNLVRNAYGYTDPVTGKFVDQSQRTGYGATLQYNGQKFDKENGAVINLSAAQLHAKDERDFSVGVNALYSNLEVGYIYANNNVKHNAYREGPGRYDIHTVHTSYDFANVAGDPNMHVYLGGYVSFVDGDSLNSDDTKDRYGVRAQAKYYF